MDVALKYELGAVVENCPSAAELRGAIVQQLGYDPFQDPPSSPSYDVHVKVARQGQGVEAHIEWLDVTGAFDGERRLISEDGDCPELARAVAFAVAVQLQLRAERARPTPALEARPEPTPSSAVPPAPPAPPPSARSVLVGVGGLARVGNQPGVAAGVHTFASIGGAAWALSVDAHATLPTTAEGGGPASFSAREVGAGAAPCLRFRIVDTCALGSLALLSVRGRGVDHAQSPTAVGFGLGLRLQVAWPWRDRLAAVAHVDVLAQLSRWDIVLNHERVWSAAPVGVAVGLDVAAIFQ